MLGSSDLLQIGKFQSWIGGPWLYYKGQEKAHLKKNSWAWRRFPLLNPKGWTWTGLFSLKFGLNDLHVVIVTTLGWKFHFLEIYPHSEEPNWCPKDLGINLTHPPVPFLPLTKDQGCEIFQRLVPPLEGKWLDFPGLSHFSRVFWKDVHDLLRE